MLARLRWWLNYLRFLGRDPYNVDANRAWAERLERTYPGRRS